MHFTAIGYISSIQFSRLKGGGENTPQCQKAVVSQHLNNHGYSHLLFPVHASTIPVEVVWNPQNSEPQQTEGRGKSMT